jgi:DNA-binding protein HU-beta
MNKQELISHVAERSGLARNDASRAVETMLVVITSALMRGDEVRLVGFGNFSITRRKAAVGRNPRTGEPMQIKATSQPKFRPGKILKDAVQ